MNSVFNLTICLIMKSSIKVCSRTYTFLKQIPKLRSKIITSIQDDGQGNTTKWNYLMNEQTSILICWIDCPYQQKIGWFSHPIYIHPNQIIFLGRSRWAIIKSMLFISHFHSGRAMFWTTPHGLWCSTLTCW